MEKSVTYKEQDVRENVNSIYNHLMEVISDLETIGEEAIREDKNIQYWWIGYKMSNSLKKFNYIVDRLNDFGLNEKLKNFSLEKIIKKIKKKG